MNHVFPSPPILHFARFVERRGSITNQRLHTHPNWQVELMIEGNPELLIEDGTFGLNPGDIVLLPPHVPHEFNYGAEYSAWYTIRFSLDSPETFGTMIVHDDGNRHLFTLLSDLIGTSNAQLSQGGKETVEHLLAALLSYNYGNPSSTRQPSDFLQVINDFLGRNCRRPISVDELARCAGYSLSHTRALYKKLTGRSLKHAVDHARFNEAIQYLLHSDQTISEIAQELGFADVFTFSRFIRRLGNDSPRTIRATQTLRSDHPRRG